MRRFCSLIEVMLRVKFGFRLAVSVIVCEDG
jgi:hypothetical protein